MDQELKQRLIGAAVVTALAAIFIPMLFDDPVDDSGQVVSELIIPEAPIVEDNVDRLPTNAEQVLNAPKNDPSSVDSAAYPDRPLDETEIAQAELSQEELNYPGPVDESGQEVEIVDDAAQVVEESMVAQTQAIPAKIHHEKPAEAKKPVKEPKTVIAKSPEDAVREKPVETKKSAEQRKASPAKSGSGLSRWYIRAGSFSREENATALWTELRKQGFPVSLETAQVNGKTLYRLKVGPELDQKRALAMQEKLDRQNKIKSILVSE